MTSVIWFHIKLDSNVRPAVRARGRTPDVIISPRFNAAYDEEEVASEFDGNCSRSDHERLKRRCLERDGGKCVATDLYDFDHIETMSLSPAEKARLRKARTHVAHILPFSLGSSVVSFLQLDF